MSTSTLAPCALARSLGAKLLTKGTATAPAAAAPMAVVASSQVRRSLSTPPGAGMLWREAVWLMVFSLERFSLMAACLMAVCPDPPSLTCSINVPDRI